MGHGRSPRLRVHPAWGGGGRRRGRPGQRRAPDADIKEKLATAPSPKFFGLFRGIVYDYTLFDRSVLQRDLERVERYYRARGYYEARVRAGRYKSHNHIEITIEVEEGRPVLIRQAQLDGLAGLPTEDAEAVRMVMKQSLKHGEPFEEEGFQKAENAMKRELTDRGYAWAKIERRADVDLPGHYAWLFFSARPGPKATFGPIRIEGLGELPEGPVRRALYISEGDPYSTTSLQNAQRAVLNLGTFSSVEVNPELKEPPPPNAVVPLLVRVQQQKLKSVLLGGGLEIDSIRTGAHLRAGWEHKNLFGGFRHFTGARGSGSARTPRWVRIRRIVARRGTPRGNRRTSGSRRRSCSRHRRGSAGAQQVANADVCPEDGKRGTRAGKTDARGPARPAPRRA